MIFDQVSSLAKYKSIPRLDRILEFLKKNDPLKLPAGEIAIDGEDLFVKVLDFVPADAKENKFEAHRFHIDVQVVFSGVESMHVLRSKHLKPISDYQEKDDVQFFGSEDGFSDICVNTNEFVVFFVGEVHKPGCRFQQTSQPVRKLVFKIKQP